MSGADRVCERATEEMCFAHVCCDQLAIGGGPRSGKSSHRAGTRGYAKATEPAEGRRWPTRTWSRVAAAAAASAAAAAPVVEACAFTSASTSASTSAVTSMFDRAAAIAWPQGGLRPQEAEGAKSLFRHRQPPPALRRRPRHATF